jgi:hypothetical protein
MYKEVVCKRWFLSDNIKAIVLFGRIWYNGNPTDELIRHEWEHFNQIKKMGWLKFYLKYIIYHFKYGYENNPFEMEARRYSKREIKK